MKFRPKLILFIILVLASILRIIALDKVPVSMFGDELDVGYQAYSILKTGKDYYGNFMPIHFHSLAEWRTPLYLYSAVPTVAIFGLTEYGVRLPAALFGIFGIWALYLLVKELFKDEKLALVAAAVLTFSPWHIQYSRAGFEVTQLLFFLILGLYFFFKGLKDGKFLWISAVCFSLTPWVYSTAKLFTPLLVLFLLILYRKELFKTKLKYIVFTFFAFLIVGGPITYSTFFGGGAQRYGYISVFSDPTTEPEVGTARGLDAKARGEVGTGLNPTLLDKAIHNKFTFWGGRVLNNYLQPFSSEFLFNSGDPNPRHTIHGMGVLYKVEFIALTLGLVLFFARKSIDTKNKLFIGFWIMASVIPAAITRDGGNHATRLILLLIPLTILISYGLLEGLNLIKNKKYKTFALMSYVTVFVVCFFFYQHNYWVHNPTYSERWWHAGYKEAIQSVKQIDSKYDKVLVSSAGEPPWIFFAAWYQYDHSSWQKNFPIGNDIELSGIGKVSHIDKFYFGFPDGGLYDWGHTLDNKILFLATAKQVNVNLIMEPERTPEDLKLLKSIAYPSGEPAFYLFTGK
ncbi:glycosyltransferase family 39 protein [Candidatus Microgenomates bacterium]|nr:glycosyltransferase family 39 protein [Candidatus Microgenomates bacterium]